MKLTDTQNTVATMLATILAAGGLGIGGKATLDAGTARDDLREWTVQIQRTLNEQRVELAALKAWRDGFQAGFEKGRDHGQR